PHCTVLICTHLLESTNTRPGLRHQEGSASTSSTTGRGTGRERFEEAPVFLEAPVEGARRVRNQGTRESLDYGRSSGRRRKLQVRRAMGAVGMYQMRELLYQSRSMHRHLANPS
ncbi:unnamed protein product, partial [Ascophyllum nodosum]